MLALKLFLVPGFLLLVSLAGKRWGAPVAGWLAGLPVVAGPILFIVALEQGAVFTAQAASAATAAIFASVSFSVVYAHVGKRSAWPVAMAFALLGWFAAALVLSLLPNFPLASAVVAATTLVVAPFLFPKIASVPTRRLTSNVELSLRMLAGAVLTIGVTLVAAWVGPRWSGLLAVFPILGIVLAVFSHRSHGSVYTAALLRSMATGLYSLLAFCLILAVSLPYAGMTAAFILSTFASLGVQVFTNRYLIR